MSDEHIDPIVENNGPFVINELITIRDLNDRYISWALKHFNRNFELTANALGITTRTIYNRIKDGGVDNVSHS